jgi:hypothetical protein
VCEGTARVHFSANESCLTESFKVTSGLITSYTVYTVRWKFPATGASGAVEHRYSDFLSLYHHLVKKFPGHQLPPFPEKKRFVTISERDAVAKERLEIFKAFVTTFEGPNNDLWSDSKVQRFFDLPHDLRQVNSHRGQIATPISIRKEAAQNQKTQKEKQRPATVSHRRAGSEMVVVVGPSRDSFATLQEPRTLRPSHKPVLANWELDTSALGEIRRSGSDMYARPVVCMCVTLNTLSSGTQSAVCLCVAHRLTLLSRQAHHNLSVSQLLTLFLQVRRTSRM